MTKPRLGLIANIEKPGARELILDLRREFRKHSSELAFEDRTAAFAGLPPGRSTRELAAECDLMIVLGGDGTILQVLFELDDVPLPIFGINLGTLGFLTFTGASSYMQAVESIVSGDYQLSDRTLLDVELRRGAEIMVRRCCLNDAVISRGELSRLIRLNVAISGNPLTEYNADGLIVSTPTGSTAYSLSAGGPVLSPESRVFVITPICPHVLTNRSVIVADDSLIEIAPAVGQSAVFLTLDGRTTGARVEPGDSIRITKSQLYVRLAMPPQVSFFEVLRQKLKWSGGVI